MTPRLIIIRGEDKGKVYELKQGRNTIGRGPENDVIITDPSVSTNHAEVIINGATGKLRDLGSTNGTRVGGRKVTESDLSHGVEVVFGQVPMGLQTEELPPPTPGGVRMEDIGVDSSPAPHKVSSQFDRVKVERQLPHPMVIVIGGLSVVLLILLALVAKRFLTH